ncbi:MAG: NADH-quinone oxidoreductase subunit NuoE [Neisseriaceae bacterium]
MLSEKSLKKIDAELTKYPKENFRSAIMSALTIAQMEEGWLSRQMIEYVADYLGIPAIQAYEGATFYNMYDVKPVGKYKLQVCTNLPCALRGGVNTLEYLKKRLGIEPGKTTLDGKFTLIEGECLGACGDAPVLLLNNHKMCSYMTEENIDKILAELS